MLNFLESTSDTLEIELAIVNSNPFYNRIAYDKEVLTAGELKQETEESLHAGAERFLIRDGKEPVGILEFLMRNPNDGYPWLGLLEIKAEYRGRGYGRQALNEFYSIMRSKQVEAIRIGVILENEPAHRFWRKQGFNEVTTKPWGKDKQVVVYERQLD